MENASKALLIAAAVLIVILIIAISMRIYNSAGDTASDAQKVGESIADKSSESAQELVNIFEKNLVRIKDHTARILSEEDSGNGFYEDNRTGLILEPKTDYQLSFDYEIKECENYNKDLYLCCGVYYYYGANITHIKEIGYLKGSEVEKGKMGDVSFSFETPGFYKLQSSVNPKLLIRFVRVQYKFKEGETLKVKIKNVIVKKVE